MKKKNLMVGIPLFIIGIAAAVAIGINASDLIISLGIVVFKIFSFVAYAALGVGFLLIAVPIVIRLLKNRAEKEALAKKAAEEEEAIRKKKEDVKGLVRELMSEEEKFVPIGQTLLKEMEDMDEFIERNEKLFKFNDMTEFESMKEIISQAKNALYHNCRGVVNLYVALESSEEFTTESGKILDSNNELLDNAKKFLLELARYTNEQNEDTDAVTLIRDYADAIGQSLKHTYN
ncbi:hypothetical protein D6853_10360 [Butyrivibrio sp. X503]|uniref:hypothetical protein n=1 Tax=Butyrivibrio sp. X503 TaxID=2364878 RepID=UPI000EAA5DD3|nr:hypothetical protein [Butyrivibrio sp. X503]RKM55132.1 hypothetical protein D6853_10360 [Butyrivibrio sp. X503]